MGPDALGKLVGFGHKHGNGIITLCHMSAPEAKATYELSVKQTKIYKLFLDWAIKKKVDGIIVGATYPDIIKQCKRKIKGSLDIYSPGVGVQGGNASNVIDSGSDYLIIGRTIINSKNPLQTIKRIHSQTL